MSGRNELTPGLAEGEAARAGLEQAFAQDPDEWFRALFETAPHARLVVDPGGRIVLVNSRTEQLFGYAREELVGVGVDRLIPISTEAPPWYRVESSSGVADGGRAELGARRADGTEFPVEVSLTPVVTERGSLVSVAVIDITERRVAAEALAHRASHDPLTGLPNRTLFLDRLEHAIGRARRSRRRFAVMFLDLDDFKLVNDTRGHNVGDLLLVGLTPRLSDALRPGDTIARFGGDEFVVLCEDLSSESDALAIAGRIAGACNGPIVVGRYEHVVTVSTGVVLVTDPETATGPDVLRDADAAMYRAKALGKGRIELFDDRMRELIVERIAIESSLRRALERGQLRVHYQPVVALEDERVVAVEALVRWEHPRRGLLAPASFLEAADSSGLIVPIGEWVTAQACREAASWCGSAGGGRGPAGQGGPAPPIRVSVNLSARQLARPGLAASVDAILRDTGLAPELLELEIAEPVLFDDLELSAQVLGELEALGVRLVLDDFGSGRSSLRHLSELPISVLKIDRSLVEGLHRGGDGDATVNAMLRMAGALDLEVIAEGLETPAQLALLRSHGCDFAQGYLLCRPAPAAELREMLGLAEQGRLSA